MFVTNIFFCMNMVLEVYAVSKHEKLRAFIVVFEDITSFSITS